MERIVKISVVGIIVSEFKVPSWLCFLYQQSIPISIKNPISNTDKTFLSPKCHFQLIIFMFISEILFSRPVLIPPFVCYSLSTF
jgi:hypothetical protein